MIIQLFKGCALTKNVNTYDDHKISCFNFGRPCRDSLKMLEQQIAAFCEARQDQNVIDITDWEVENANIEENIIPGDEDDIDIEIYFYIIKLFALG